MYLKFDHKHVEFILVTLKTYIETEAPVGGNDVEQSYHDYIHEYGINQAGLIALKMANALLRQMKSEVVRVMMSDDEYKFFKALVGPVAHQAPKGFSLE